MRSFDILILGSSYLTELAVKHILDMGDYNLIGYVPCRNTPVNGKVPLKQVEVDTPCDIKLSLQYDIFVEDTSNAYNLHTGLLPDYGGRDILDHTIKNKDNEQGLTFHKMTRDLDYGPIISKITYPVLDTDCSFDLYKRMLEIAPSFVYSSLKLLESMEEKQIEKCYKYPPRMYNRGEFELSEKFKEFIKCKKS
tara:strand:+ start:7751 stop:8332 length:582 start_codon:yes stop_codon:yes gene_type:complete